mmetsp:Transcript_68197/g.177034  ORF Transcript_68197/g.177034 Transcript_68197/m.177034 type:complete len:99 (-) Transcript_68197:2-298(-)
MTSPARQDQVSTRSDHCKPDVAAMATRVCDRRRFHIGAFHEAAALSGDAPLAWCRATRGGLCHVAGGSYAEDEQSLQVARGIGADGDMGIQSDKVGEP